MQEIITAVTIDGREVKIVTQHIKYWSPGPKTGNTTISFGGNDRIVIKGELAESALYGPKEDLRPAYVLDCTPCEDEDKPKPKGFNMPNRF